MLLIRVGRAALALMFAVAIALIPQSTSAEANALKLIVQVDSASLALPDTETVVSVNVTNLSDSIAAFAMKLRLENNGHIHFAIDSVSYDGSDSTCFASIESVGTRTQNWESLTATVSYDLTGEELIVTGICDDGALPTVFALRPGSGTFLRVVLEVNADFPLSLCNAQLSTMRLIESATKFYNPAGEPIGFKCTGLDSINVNCVFDSTEALYLDGTVTSWCCLWNGQLYQCGDCDGNGMINISDAVCIISWIFGWPGRTPSPACMLFANGDGIVSISDVVYLINYIFAGGPAPRCE